MFRRVLLLGTTALIVGCLPAQDEVTLVHDLRVLGAQNEPPELMTPVCPTADGGIGLDQLITWATPVQYTALIADPNGGGRSVHYELFACARPGDKICASIDDTATLASGDIAPDAGTNWMLPTVTRSIGTVVLANGNPLLLRVLQQDPNQGFGGIRLPLVLHVTAGSEEIFAEKLMVFSCAIFPDQTAAINPVLPGIQLEGTEWPDGTTPTITGPGPFALKADDFSALELPYVEPAFDLSEVHAVESWKIDWYSEYGAMSPSESGGAVIAFGHSDYSTQWTPPKNPIERDINFYFTVRNGRGGMSWLFRRLHYRP